MSNKQKLFNIISVVVIVGLICFYGYRLFYYRNYFANQKEEQRNFSLSNYIINNIDLMASDGLKEKEDGSYIFEGKCNDNYLVYSNRLYRLISIDLDGNIMAISEKGITELPLYENDSFDHTSVYQFLVSNNEDNTGLFEKTLSDKVSNLSVVKSNVGIITDINNLPTDTIDLKVSLLSLADYLAVGGENSFINNGEKFWLVNQDADNNYYYVDNTGAIGFSYSKALSLAIRPVICFNHSIYHFTGSGTIDDPYVIQTSGNNEESVSALNKTHIGQYVLYSGQTFIITGFDENNNPHLLANDVLLDENGNPIMKSFGKSNNYLESNVYKYLNTTYLKSLFNYEEYCLKTSYSYGLYNNVNEYNYRDNLLNKYECYVGLPYSGMFELKGSDDYFLSSQAYESEKLIYIIKENILYASLLNENHCLRPVITLRGELPLIDGNGTIDNPFVIGAYHE